MSRSGESPAPSATGPDRSAQPRSHRRPIVLAALPALVVAIVAGGFLARSSRPPSYPALRQAAVQQLPGSLGFEIAPPPEGFEPAVTPERARVQGTYGEEAYRTAVLSLATARDVYEGISGPAWVVLTRGICIADFKGELVQASRHPNRQGICDERNLWFEMIDASTGQSLMRTRGYDRERTFELIRAGV